MYSCGLCGYHSDRRFNVERHKKTVHKNDGDNPWDVIIDKTFETCQKDFEQKVKENQDRPVAYKDMFDKYRYQMTNHYLGLMFWQQDMNRDFVHRKIKSTVKRLRQNDNMDIKEAWKVAVEKRKFLLDNVLDRYKPPSGHGDVGKRI